MRRRTFLTGAAGLLASTSFLGGARTARAFGIAPSADLVLPSDRTVQGILEVFMLGGVSPYESFYVVEEFGQGATPSQWHSFLESGHVQTALDACNLADQSLLKPFGEDARGREVKLGPFISPLRNRADLLDRLRVIVTTHDAAPHEVGIPLALTGRRPGDISLAGLGAHIQRHFGERDGVGTPVSYVIQPPSSVQRELMRAVAATGRHPGFTRPLQLRIDGFENMLDLMGRPSVDGRASTYDAVMERLNASFGGRVRVEDRPLRAPPLTEFDSTCESLAYASDVVTLLGGAAPQPIASSLCGVETDFDATATSLRVAVDLLNHPTSPARYVCVVDGGLGPQRNAGGYDSHENTPRVQATNLTSLLTALTGIINSPGENDPKKLDLDRTLIVLNTEFGRSPVAGENLGRGHWPHAFPVMMLGGPIRADNAGILGAMDADALPELASTPTHHRIAALMSLGIWPFDQESYNVGDVPDAASNADAFDFMRRTYLGVK